MTIHKVGPSHYEVRRDGEVIAYVTDVHPALAALIES